MVTALGMASKRSLRAIVSQAEKENPSQPKPSEALVPDDILSAVGSKFFPLQCQGL
jgi:hypothetical protein